MDGIKYRTAIRAIVDKFDCDTRLTANQNIVFCGIKKTDMAEVRLNPSTQEVDMIELAPFRVSRACPTLRGCV